MMMSFLDTYLYYINRIRNKLKMHLTHIRTPEDLVRSCRFIFTLYIGNLYFTKRYKYNVKAPSMKCSIIFREKRYALDRLLTRY